MRSIRILIRLIIRILSIRHRRYTSHPMSRRSRSTWVPYLVLSIITTVCCCLPFGVVGIVYATKINSAMNAGNYEEAQRSAKTAKIWIIVAAAVGVIAKYYCRYKAAMGAMDSYYYYY